MPASYRVLVLVTLLVACSEQGLGHATDPSRNLSDPSTTAGDAGPRDGGRPGFDAAPPGPDASLRGPDASPPVPDAAPPQDDAGPCVGKACTPPSECDEGAEERSPCGRNARGNQMRSCHGGRWSDFGPCADPDECLDATRDGQACGPNGRGAKTRTCEAGRWGEFGACVDSDVCVDNATEQQSCGVNDRAHRQRSCTHGSWSAWSVCDDEDACRDRTRETRSCGFNERGTQARECSHGVWSEFGTCSDPDDCRDGDRSTHVCGRNARGSQPSTCEHGKWSFAECVDSDVCTDGASEQGSCGLNDRGVRARVCATGAWAGWQACADDDVCVDNARDIRVCGQNNRGQSTRVCGQGAWQPFSDCVDPDECRDGDSFQEACGPGGSGKRSRTCVAGKLSAWSVCSVVCGNGALEGPEACDDGNTVGRDGCASDCRVERIEWIHQLPGGPDDTTFSDDSLLQPDGTFVVWVNAHSDFYYPSEDKRPRVDAVRPDGRHAFSYGFEISQLDRFAASSIGAGPRGETLLYFRFKGKSRVLGDASRRETILLHSLSNEGYVRASAGLVRIPSGGQPVAAGRAFTPDGDLSLYGWLGAEEDARLNNAQIDHRRFGRDTNFFLRVDASTLETVVTSRYGARFKSNQPRLVGFAANVERQVAVLAGEPSSSFEFEDGTVTPMSPCFVFSVDNQGRSLIRYAFPPNVTALSPEPILIGNGETVLDTGLYVFTSGASIDDATGRQAVDHGLHVMWFAPDGSLRLVRRGDYAGMHGENLLITSAFKNRVELETGTPWAKTLTTEGEQYGQYLAEYRPDGTLVALSLLLSQKEDPRNTTLSLAGEALLVSTPCKPELVMGDDERNVALPGWNDNDLCVAGFDAGGTLRWAKRLPSQVGQSTLVQQGSWAWHLNGNAVTRYDADGNADYTVTVAAADHLLINEAGAWVLSQLRGGNASSMVPGDPMDIQVDGSRGSLVLVKLRLPR